MDSQKRNKDLSVTVAGLLKQTLNCTVLFPIQAIV